MISILLLEVVVLLFINSTTLNIMIALRDGKVDYEDELGNAILAPWMIPPDEPNHHPKGGNMNSNTQQQQHHHQQQQQSNFHQLSHNNIGGGNNMMRSSSVGVGTVDHPHVTPFIPSGQLHHPYGFIQYNTNGPAYVNDPRVSIYIRSMCVCTSICMYACTNVCMFVCMYVCMYVCYVCMIVCM